MCWLKSCFQNTHGGSQSFQHDAFHFTADTITFRRGGFRAIQRKLTITLMRLQCFRWGRWGKEGALTNQQSCCWCCCWMRGYSLVTFLITAHHTTVTYTFATIYFFFNLPATIDCSWTSHCSTTCRLLIMPTCHGFNILQLKKPLSVLERLYSHDKAQSLAVLGLESWGNWLGV